MKKKNSKHIELLIAEVYHVWNALKIFSTNHYANTYCMVIHNVLCRNFFFLIFNFMKLMVNLYPPF